MSISTVERATQAPRIFTSEYYARMNEAEARRGWCRGMRQLALRLVDHYCRSSRPMRILDAGWGTGGLLAGLENFAGALRAAVDPARRMYCVPARAPGQRRHREGLCNRGKAQNDLRSPWSSLR